MTHTPGPWLVDSPNRKTNKGYEVRSSNDECITGWGSVTQTEANARLIAAAPDMKKELEAAKVINKQLLEACEFMYCHFPRLMAYESLINEDMTEDEKDNKYTEIILAVSKGLGMAQAAIAAAKGGDE